MNACTKTATIEIDGHQWIQRAGEPCGTYETLTSYLGRASIEPQGIKGTSTSACGRGRLYTTLIFVLNQ